MPENKAKVTETHARAVDHHRIRVFEASSVAW